MLSRTASVSFLGLKISKSWRFENSLIGNFSDVCTSPQIYQRLGYDMESTVEWGGPGVPERSRAMILMIVAGFMTIALRRKVAFLIYDW